MFCYFYLLAEFLETMKNTRFFASFFANRKKKKRQAARAAGAEGFPPPAGRGAQATRRRATRRAGAGARSGRETAPAALPRDKQKFTALPSEARAAKPRGLWSERGRGKRRGARHKGSEATAPISGAARRRSPNDRRAGTRARASKPRRNGEGKGREEKAAHVTNYPRSLRYARGAHRREAQRSKQAHGESTPKPKQCERIATRARPTRRERKEQTAERSGADRRRSATAAVSIRR